MDVNGLELWISSVSLGFIMSGLLLLAHLCKTRRAYAILSESYSKYVLVLVLALVSALALESLSRLTKFTIAFNSMFKSLSHKL